MKSNQLGLFDFLKPSEPEIRYESYSSVSGIPSLLKWTGSKRSQALRIARYAPEFKRYFEPFIGGGALVYLLGKPGSVGGDIYEPLVRFWILVRDNPQALIDNYYKQWTDLQLDLPGYFYLVRDRFNKEKGPEDLNFLMRTCVNGIVRFSKKGDFNNSFHLSRRGMRPNRFADIVTMWSRRIAGIEFRCDDFSEIVLDCKKGDFVYMDPPYAGNKQRYIGGLQIDRLLSTLESLNSREVKWAVSFDGKRGDKVYNHVIPKEIYKRKELMLSGYSAVSKVLNGPVEMVTESLYFNY